MAETTTAMQSIEIDLNETFTFRQRKANGEWRYRHFTLGEMYEAYVALCEESAEVPLSLGRWIVEMAQYGCRRELALDKDQTRFDRGQKPHTIYTARTHVEDVRKNADQVRAEAKQHLAVALKMAVGKAPSKTAKAAPQKAAPAPTSKVEKVERHSGNKPLWMRAAGL